MAWNLYRLSKSAMIPLRSLGLNNCKIFEVAKTHSYSEQGTYFITLREVSQRNGSTQTPFTHIQNLDRVSVVVKYYYILPNLSTHLFRTVGAWVNRFLCT